MKKLLVLIVIVGGVAAASPMYLGSKVNSNLQSLADKLNAEPGYSAELIEYSNSYMGGEGKMRIGFDLFGAANLDDMPSDLRDSMDFLNTVVSLKTKNGPMSAYTEITFDALDDLSESDLAEIKKVFGSEKFYDAYMTTDALGASKLTISIPEFSLDEDEGQMKFAGLDMNLDLTNGMNQWAYTLKAGAMEGDFNGMAMKFSGMDIDSDTDVSEGFAVAVGDSSMSMEEFTMSQAGQSVSVKGFTATANQENNAADESLIDAVYQMKINSLSAMDEAFAVEDFVFGMTFERFKKSAVKDLYAQINSGMNASPDMMMKSAGDLLGSSPKMSIDNFDFKMGGSEFKMSGSLGLNSDVLGTMNIMQNPLMAIPALEVGVDMKVDESFMDVILEVQAATTGAFMSPEQKQQMMAQQKAAYEQQLEGVIAQGIVKREGGKLVSNLQFKDGSLTVNGQPMPLPFM